MINKKVLNVDRVRKINGSFSFIPHRFVLDGFLAALGQEELLIYLFLVLVSDRNGLSFYSYDSICTLLEISLEEYIASRDSLIEKDLIAFDGTVFQVLSLPKKEPDKKKRQRRAALEELIQQTVKGCSHDR